MLRVGMVRWVLRPRGHHLAPTPCALFQSRILQQQPGERNFHAFYQVNRGTGRGGVDEVGSVGWDGDGMDGIYGINGIYRMGWGWDG